MTTEILFSDSMLIVSAAEYNQSVLLRNSSEDSLYQIRSWIQQCSSIPEFCQDSTTHMDEENSKFCLPPLLLDVYFHDDKPWICLIDMMDLPNETRYTT